MILKNYSSYQCQASIKNVHLISHMVLYKNEQLLMLMEPSNLNGPNNLSKYIINRESENSIPMQFIYRYSLRNIYLGTPSLISIIEVNKTQHPQEEDFFTQKYLKGQYESIIEYEQTNKFNPLLSQYFHEKRYQYLMRKSPKAKSFAINKIGDIIILIKDGRAVFLRRTTQKKEPYQASQQINLNQLICKNQSVNCCCFCVNNDKVIGICTSEYLYIYKQDAVLGKLQLQEGYQIRQLILLQNDNKSQFTAYMLKNQTIIKFLYRINDKSIDKVQKRKSADKRNKNITKSQNGQTFCIKFQFESDPKYIDSMHYTNDQLNKQKIYIVVGRDIYSLRDKEIVFQRQIEQNGIKYIDFQGRYIPNNMFIPYQQELDTFRVKQETELYKNINRECIKQICRTDNGMFITLTHYYQKNYKQGRLILYCPNCSDLLSSSIVNIRNNYIKVKQGKEIVTRCTAKFQDILFLGNKPIKTEIMDLLSPCFKKYIKSMKQDIILPSFKLGQLTITNQQLSILMMNMSRYLPLQQLQLKEAFIKMRVKEYLDRQQIQKQLEQSDLVLGCVRSGRRIIQQDVMQCQNCGVYSIAQGQQNEYCYICWSQMKFVQ